MPDLILEFKLPEEEGEARDAIDGALWKNVAQVVDDELRRLEKYEGEDTISIEHVRRLLRESTEERGLRWD